ncbi:MAG: class I SAM-dependent methyltransferase, partial [Candidatus Sulfotelmatobacter sp.]
PSPDPDSQSKPDPNIHRYNSPEVASHYAALDYLTPCERLLFDEYLKPGADILDLGVGGGRLTPHLSSIAGRYVGADYAAEMVAACRKKFPQLEFAVANAADLSCFASASFDAVVMAFNAFDYVLPDEARVCALREIRRVLRFGGVFIFSSHNPRAILVRVSWNRQRVRNLAERIAQRTPILGSPLFGALAAARAVLAALHSTAQSVGLAGRRLPTKLFWQGEGYWMDSVHGGLNTRYAVPAKVVAELQKFGFALLRVLGDDYPMISSQWVTGWYYYVFRNNRTAEEN